MGRTCESVGSPFGRDTVFIWVCAACEGAFAAPPRMVVETQENLNCWLFLLLFVDLCFAKIGAASTLLGRKAGRRWIEVAEQTRYSERHLKCALGLAPNFSSTTIIFVTYLNSDPHERNHTKFIARRPPERLGYPTAQKEQDIQRAFRHARQT
jgi:hypothetical protein